MRRSHILIPALSKQGIAFEALFVAVTVALPVLSHAVGWSGTAWLPMHWGVLASSITLGPLAGLVIGLVAPPLNAVLTGLPPAPIVPAMMAELAVYGCIPGLVIRIAHTRDASAVRSTMVAAGSLVAGQIVGRAVFLAAILIYGPAGPATALSTAPTEFIRSAFAPGLFAALAQVAVLSAAFTIARRRVDHR